MKVLTEVEPTSSDAKTEYAFTNGNSEVWSQDKLYTFVLNDGTVVSVENTDGIANGNISLVVDLNGFKTPNIGGKDLCKYVVGNNAIVGEQCSAMASFESNTPEVCGTGFFMSENGECVANDVAHCKIQTQSGICDECMPSYPGAAVNTSPVPLCPPPTMANN